MSIEAMKRALELAREGVEIHNENSPEYKVCAALLSIAEAEKQEPAVYIPADALRQITPPLLILRGVSLYGYRGDGLTPLYTHSQPKRELLTDEQIKRLIVEFGKEFSDFDSLPEVCLLVSYDPEVGRIPERWEPKWHVFQAVRYVLHAAHRIKGEA